MIDGLLQLAGQEDFGRLGYVRLAEFLAQEHVDPKELRPFAVGRVEGNGIPDAQSGGQHQLQQDPECIWTGRHARPIFDVSVSCDTRLRQTRLLHIHVRVRTGKALSNGAELLLDLDEGVDDVGIEVRAPIFYHDLHRPLV